MRNKNWLYIGGIKIRNDYIEYIVRLGKIYQNKKQFCFRVISDLGEYSSTDVCCFNTKKTARNKQAELQRAVDESRKIEVYGEAIEMTAGEKIPIGVAVVLRGGKVYAL